MILLGSNPPTEGRFPELGKPGSVDGLEDGLRTLGRVLGEVPLLGKPPDGRPLFGNVDGRWGGFTLGLCPLGLCPLGLFTGGREIFGRGVGGRLIDGVLLMLPPLEPPLEPPLRCPRASTLNMKTAATAINVMLAFFNFIFISG